MEEHRYLKYYTQINSLFSKLLNEFLFVGLDYTLNR